MTDAASALAAWENDGGPPGEAPSRQPARLDWAAFTARFYPNARWHDYAPIAAYVAYRESLAADMHDSGSARGNGP